jgi:hypothetical protein
VTRAYTEARHRGLTQTRIGQGTFVVECLSFPRRSAYQAPEFDLSMNLPPQPLDSDLEGRFTRGLAAIQREVGFSALPTYRDPRACQAECNIAAEWLRSRIAEGRGDRLMICPGTQKFAAGKLLREFCLGSIFNFFKNPPHADMRYRSRLRGINCRKFSIKRAHHSCIRTCSLHHEQSPRRAAITRWYSQNYQSWHCFMIRAEQIYSLENQRSE